MDRVHDPGGGERLNRLAVGRLGVRHLTLALTVALTLASTLVGCASEQRASPRADSSSVTPAAAKSAAMPEWRTVSWEPYAGTDPADLGLGVAFLAHAEDKGATTGSDTLVLRVLPNDTSRAAGAMVFTIDSVGVTHYTVAAADSLRPNLVEYGYEESGVPFDSADASGRWVRGLLGTGPNGTLHVGWIDTRQRGVQTIRWTHQLADRPIYFPRPDAAAFFATADSSKPVPAPAGGADAYAMHPVEARGAWLRVQVVEPSDNCEPDSAPRRKRHVWIRYLDARGRPNVWYYPRGC